MWGSIMAVNSFVIWPLSLIFLVYSIGRAVIFLDWKIFVIAALIFAASIATQMVLSILADTPH